MQNSIKLHSNYHKFIETLSANFDSAKLDRIIDFAVLANNKLFLIETNYYSGGGSKLKSTAGEYQNDFLQWQADSHCFIWITDGKGWLTTLKPLRDAFDKIDIVLNLDMIQNGLLVDYIKNIISKA